jgi:hypothetical protein
MRRISETTSPTQCALIRMQGYHSKRRGPLSKISTLQQWLRNCAQGEKQSRELQSSPKRNDLILNMGKFKPKGVLKNNGDFCGKQFIGVWWFQKATSYTIIT